MVIGAGGRAGKGIGLRGDALPGANGSEKKIHHEGTKDTKKSGAGSRSSMSRFARWFGERLRFSLLVLHALRAFVVKQF